MAAGDDRAVEETLKARRAGSFGNVAEHYDRFRPGPPEEAVRWALPEGFPAGASRVVDIGAGTGGLTRVLLALEPPLGEVVAVEPDDRMRAVLERRAPAARALDGSAEAIPLPDACADAVIGASMWHWVDPQRAVPEVARVLRPGGVLGLLWSGPDRQVPWVGELLGTPGAISIGMSATDVARRDRVALPEGSAAFFGEPDRRRIDWTRQVGFDELIGLAGTYSRFLTAPTEERDSWLADYRRRAAEHPQVAGRDVIELPMACRCWRAVRL